MTWPVRPPPVRRAHLSVLTIIAPRHHLASLPQAPSKLRLSIMRASSSVMSPLRAAMASTPGPSSSMASTSRLVLPSRGATPTLSLRRPFTPSAAPSASQLLRQRASPFSTSTPRTEPTHHFDTHALVTRLESSGMPRAQADSLVAALNDVISESLRQLEKGCVGREEGEKWRYAQKVGRSSRA